MNSKREPTLEELGLSDPVSPPSKKISIEQLQRESETEQTQQIRTTIPSGTSSRMPILAAVSVVLFCCVGFAGLAALKSATTKSKQQYSSQVPSNTESTVSPSVTYGDALQILVDEIDGKLNANIFGKVSASGRSAKVIVESDYFTRLDAHAQRFALESIAEQWKTKCYGKNIKFTTWNGNVVAEF